MATPSLRLPERRGRCEAEDVLRWAYAEFGDKLCLTCSWQKQSSVLVHMVSELGLDLPVVELDTQLFFRESYETRDALVERYGLTLSAPARDHRRRAAPARGPEPLGDATPTAAATSARSSRSCRRSSPTTPGSPASAATSRRAARPRRRCSGRSATSVWKVHPLADWDEKRVWAYIQVNEIPYNPLHDVGYRSIGCIPCTRPTSPEEEERAGRWAGSDKLECGIHLDTPRRRHMTDHIYAPSTRRRRTSGPAASRSGSRASPAPARPRSRTSSAPSSTARGLVVEYLDGDTVRTHLSKGLGFSKEDRDTHIERVGWVASRLTRQGGAVIAATISPYEATRQEPARTSIEERHVRRDLRQDLGRGVRQARREGPLREGVQGRDQGVHGRLGPLRGAVDPEIVIDTEEHEPEESAALVVAKLEELGLVPAEVAA